MYWWLYPSRLTWFILLPIFIGCSWMGPDSFAIYNHPANYIEGYAFWIGLLGLFFYGAGAHFAEPTHYRAETQNKLLPATLNRFLLFFYAITIAANLIFLFPVLSSPQLILNLASGSTSAMYELRDTLNQIPGITSFVGLQSLCMVLHFAYKSMTGQKTPRVFVIPLAILAFLCFMRAWLWSERLAILEFGLPIVVCLFASPTEKKKAVWTLAPLLGFIGLFFVFSVGEYFRTWQAYQDTTTMSFFEFVSARFAGYYATALNNGSSIVTFLSSPYEPINTAQWFYRLPFWAWFDVSMENNIFFSAEDWFSFLKYRANAEYNNPGGLYMPFYDFGPIIGLVIWSGLGYLSGLLFKMFLHRTYYGQILFPVWFIGILEIPRIFYWGNSRFFPVVVAAILLAAFFDKRSRQLQQSQ